MIQTKRVLLSIDLGCAVFRASVFVVTSIRAEFCQNREIVNKRAKKTKPNTGGLTFSKKPLISWNWYWSMRLCYNCSTNRCLQLCTAALSVAERNYTAVEREELAVVWSLTRDRRQVTMGNQLWHGFGWFFLNRCLC